MSGADAVALAFLDVTLRSRNITIDELAARCGWNLHGFTNQRTAGFPCLPLRFRVELELGFLPVWSSGSESDLRARCFEHYKLDPRTAALPELKELCRKLGVQPPSVRRQEEWVSSLFAWLAVNPKPKTIQ